jgi:hypothetical protein
VEWRNRLAIDDELLQSMLSRWKQSHWTEQHIVSLEIADERVAEALHRLIGGDESAIGVSGVSRINLT